jgi:hypothetical protein
MTLGTWVQEFQTLTVGIVGFAGIILTLCFNARQAREQRREERRHECQTLRAALLEELKINRETLVSNMRDVRETAMASRKRAGISCPPILWTMLIGRSPIELVCYPRRR